MSDAAPIHPAYELATQVIDARNNHEDFKNDKAPPSRFRDEHIRQLIRMAYDASLLPDEGRYPSVRLVWSPHGRQTIYLGDNAPFDAIRLEGAESLQRIAPIARRPGSALAVSVDHSGQLQCVGIYDYASVVNIVGIVEFTDMWEAGESLTGPVLSVRIEGPGRIRAGLLPAASFLLQGGKVQERRSWAVIPPAHAWLDDVCADLTEELTRRMQVLVPDLMKVPKQLDTLIYTVWSHVLNTVVASHHGGAFVINLCDSLQHVSGGMPAEWGLRIPTMQALLRSFGRASGKFDVFREIWKYERLQVFAAAEQLAGLAEVDGCVLLDKKFILNRFGARLRSDGNHELPPELSGTGTRHNAAFQYCSDNKAVVFVVSQDGHLTVIAHRDGQPPEVIRDVDPGMQWSQN